MGLAVVGATVGASVGLTVVGATVGVPVGLVDHEYESYPSPAVKVTLEPQRITSSVKSQFRSAKKLVAPGVSKHPVFVLKLGSSDIVNVGFMVPWYVAYA